MVYLGQSNSKEIFTGAGRLYAAGFNRSVFERMCREWTSLSANCSRKCRSSGSVCSAFEDVDEANGKIILTVSEADAAMYQQKKCIRAALRFDSDNKNLSRFPVDFTGTLREVFLLFLSGKPMLLCQRNSGIPLRQPPMRPWTTKLTLPSRNCCLLYYWPNCCHHRQVHARVNLFHN